MKSINENGLYLLFVLLSLNAASQDNWPQASDLEDCSCRKTFHSLIEKLEANYIGLAQLRLDHQEREYERVKARYKRQVKDISAQDCTRFLGEFLEFFQDGHLGVYEFPKLSEEELREIKSKLDKSKLSKQKLDSMLQVENKDDLLHGMWTDGKSIFVMSEMDGTHYAYILETLMDGIKVGMLKSKIDLQSKNRFHATYYGYDFTPRFATGGLYKEGKILTMSGGIFLAKNFRSN